MKFFGTDGIRGIANQDLNVEFCVKIGRAVAKLFGHSRILIGKDTRISGDMIAFSVASGICSSGVDVTMAGVLPTPAIAFLTKLHNFDAGIMISASHNPYEHNGIKIFNSEGYKLSDEEEKEIESLICCEHCVFENKVGRIYEDLQLSKDYVKFVESILNFGACDLNICIDSANGSNYKISEKIFSPHFERIHLVGNKPNGININHCCGSTSLGGFVGICREFSVDVGISFDGDGDRIIMVDELGEIVDGDQLMAIIGLSMLKEDRLKFNTIVATVMSNMGFLTMAKNNDISVVLTNVGDKNVLREMRDRGFTLGGEQSGHIISSEYSTTGDGLVAAVQILNIMKKTGKKLSELKTVVNVMPQVIVSASVKNENKQRIFSDCEIRDEIQAIEEKFKGQGRVLIRPSGTESLVRIMIEGECRNSIFNSANALAKLISNKFGEGEIA